jgi:hypothetical protein
MHKVTIGIHTFRILSSVVISSANLIASLAGSANNVCSRAEASALGISNPTYPPSGEVASASRTAATRRRQSMMLTSRFCMTAPVHVPCSQKRSNILVQGQSVSAGKTKSGCKRFNMIIYRQAMQQFKHAKNTPCLVEGECSLHFLHCVHMVLGHVTHYTSTFSHTIK